MGVRGGVGCGCVGIVERGGVGGCAAGLVWWWAVLTLWQESGYGGRGYSGSRVRSMVAIIVCAARETCLRKETTRVLCSLRLRRV